MPLGRLGRRGRRAFRQKPLRLVGVFGQPRPGRGAPASATATACACPTRSMREHGIDLRQCESQCRGTRPRRCLPRTPHRAGPRPARPRPVPSGTVLGTFGVERHAMTFHGQAAHSGSTPMNRRRDAFLAAAKMASEIYAHHGSARGRLYDRELRARRSRASSPASSRNAGSPSTSVISRPPALARTCWREARRKRANVFRPGRRETCTVDLGTDLEHRPPCCFIRSCLPVCDAGVGGGGCDRCHRLPSGPLHDAAEVASRRRADGDDVRAKPARHQPQQDRGHTRRSTSKWPSRRSTGSRTKRWRGSAVKRASTPGRSFRWPSARCFPRFNVLPVSCETRTGSTSRTRTSATCRHLPPPLTGSSCPIRSSSAPALPARI